MKLIVGLGNPGKEYEHTRHNMGFDVVTLFGDEFKIDIDKEAFHGLVGRGKVYDEDVILFKPQTFMNLSGIAVSEVLHFFKLDLDDLIVVYDDIDTEPGHIRLKPKGSAGGHNGMKDIIKFLSSENFKRIRVGIGKPEHDLVSHVLSKPKDEEAAKIEEGKKQAFEALKSIIKVGFDKTMSLYNK